MPVPVPFTRNPPCFIGLKDVKDLAILIMDAPYWTFYPAPPGVDHYEFHPLTFSDGTLDAFSDQLWDYHLDYQKTYRLSHLGQEGPDEEANPPDLQTIYFRITKQVVPRTTAELDYNYLPKGDHDDATAPPFGWSEVAWPMGVDPPYTGYDLFSVSCGPGITDGDLAGTNYYYRPDIGATAFSTWAWVAAGQDTIVQDFKTDFETHTFDDEIVTDESAPILAIIEPNLQSATDTRVIHETNPDDPDSHDPAKIIYHAGKPDDLYGNDGDYWIDTTRLPFVAYGPRATTWPADPIPRSAIPDEVGETYQSKVAQIRSGFFTSAARLTEGSNRRLWFFDSAQIQGAWTPIYLAGGDYPPYLPDQKPIREGDYRPEPSLFPGPQPEQSPYPGFAVAIYLPEDSHFPVGGLDNTENDFHGALGNPIPFDPGDLCNATVTTNPFYFIPGDPEQAILESDSVDWTGPAGETQTALLERQTLSYKYFIEVSTTPFS